MTRSCGFSIKRPPGPQAPPFCGDQLKRGDASGLNLTEYDRPIPRRIIESAGVPRGAFARHKNAVIKAYSYPVSRALRREFFAHLSARYGVGPRTVYFYAAVNRLVFLAAVVVNRFKRRLGRPGGTLPGRVVGRHIDLPYEMHLWALRTLASDLRRRTAEVWGGGATCRSGSAAVGR